MVAPFAALDARVTDAVFRHLANAEVTVGVGSDQVTFNAILDESDAPLFDGSTITSGLMLRYPRSATNLKTDDTINVNGQAYTVRGMPTVISLDQVEVGLLRAT